MMTAAALAAAAALALLAEAPDPIVVGSPEPEINHVALVAPRTSRLAQQLRRELQASGFQVTALPEATAPALKAAGTARAVVVDPRGDRVQLLSRSGTALVATDDLAVSARDDLASRRVALAVVEQLRRPPAADPATPAPTAVPAAPTPAAAAAAAAALEPEPAPQPRRRPWSLSAATSLDLDGGVGESTGHVLLVGETALSGALSGSVRVHWPLLGAQLHLIDRRVRLWTWSTAAGLRLRLRSWGRLQPLLGATAGMRFALSDTDWFDPRQSRVSLTPALSAGGFGGARFAVTPQVHVALEASGELCRLLGSPWFSYERDAAEAPAVRLALGVVFEY
jgi:hypothetical protein